MNPLFNHYASKLDLTLLQYEAVCALANSLFEDAASTAKHKAKRTIRNVLPQFNTVFDEIAKDDRNKPILTDKGNTQTVIEYLEHHLRNTFFHDGITNIKFEPGAARIAYGELGLQANEDSRKLTLLGKILQEISIAHDTEYDSNLNGMTFEELNERFGASIRKSDAETQEKLKNKTYERSDYIIKWIPDFSTAQQYSQYTDYGPNEHWCLTHQERMWGSYTGSHNENKVYFCHVPNFESVPRETGPNAPLDTYGLSLISVIVTPDKQLRAVTCRWNHTNGGSDGVMNDEQLSDLLGGYVFDLCPPYSREEVTKRGYIYLEDVQQMLDDGIDLNEYIDGKGRIRINDKMNILHGRKLLSDQWFDWIGDFENGLAVVRLNEKYNFIDTEGNIRFNQWFEAAFDFKNGFSIVRLNKKCNFINTEGNILSDQWFDWVSNFKNGFAKVQINGKFNFIDTEGTILSDQVFDKVYDFNDGFAVVTLNGKYNFINTEGKLLSDQWFDSVYTNMFSELGFDSTHIFCDGFARVQLNKKYNFLSTKGNILSDQWFDWVSNFKNGVAKVQLNGTTTYIDTKGNLLSDKRFDSVSDFKNGFAEVRLNKKYNFINTEGNLLYDQWFDWATPCNNGFVMVVLKEKYNFINTEGKLLSDQWFEWADNFFDNGFAKVFFNGTSYHIDTKGNLSR